MIKSQILSLIEQAVSQAFPGAKDYTLAVSHPELEQHGDYSTNIALILAKQLQLSPRDVATKIAAAVPKSDMVSAVEVAGPGFINLTIAPTVLWQEVVTVLRQGDAYGRETDQSRKVMFEYGCPNTHKMPHIGHLFSYCYGESMSRILEATGSTLFRENYQGDVGLHVARCLWGFMKDLGNNQAAAQSADLSGKVLLLQRCYQEGAQAYEDDANAKQEIDELNKKIYAQDPEVFGLWQETRQWSIDYYELFEQRIGSRFQQHFYESQSSVVGKEAVLQHVGDVFTEDQGAIIFRGEDYGLHTRVFINSHGNPTYEAKEVGLLALKLTEDFPFDLAVYSTAHEQNDYMKVAFKAIELIFPQVAGKLKHIGYGMVNLTTGKMSSRTGKIITAVDLIETVKDRVKEYIKEHRDYSEAEIEHISEIVAVGAIKYSFLRSAATKNIAFDIESSISFDGNSGPYLQYTYARCQSLLQKAGVDVVADSSPTQDWTTEELALLKWFYRYDEAIQEAAQQYSPHALAGYLFELAQRFSVFYNNQQIITENLAVTKNRLALTAGTAQILKNGLNLLGIEVANKI